MMRHLDLTLPSGKSKPPAALDTPPLITKSMSSNDGEFDCCPQGRSVQQHPKMDEFQWSLSLPPVDHVSVYTTDFESSSDVSSVSSDDDTVASHEAESIPSLPVVPARSIFGRYWDTNPSESPVFKAARSHGRSVSTTQCSTVDDNDEYYANDCATSFALPVPSTIDGPTQAAPFGSTVLSPSTTERRQIFQFQETSPLTRVSLFQSPEDMPQRCLVRCLSSSTQASKPSCLRSSRFAPGSTKRELSVTSLSDTSVSFSPKVDVLVYTRPAETWAVNNWMDYFT